MTEREEEVDQLRDARTRLERILESTGAGVWEHNLQTGETVVDERWAEIVGYTLAELGGAGTGPWRGLAHPDDVRRADDLSRRHQVGELPSYDCEVRLRHKDGQWVWVESRGRILTRTAEGQPLMMFGTHIDISDRKAAEAALRESEERFRTMFEEATVGVALADLSTGRFLEVNERYAEIAGLTREVMTTVGWMSITHPDDLGTDLAFVERLLAGEIESYRMEKRYLRPDGAVVWVDMTVNALRTGDPRQPLALTIAQDITERKAAEGALLESRALLQAIVEGTTDAVYTKDLEGRMLLFNAGSAALTGKSVAEVLGKDDRFLFPPDEAAVVMAGDREVMRSGVTSTYEERVTAADGVVHTLLSTKGPVRDVTGAVVGLFGIARDITERKAAEAEIRRLNADLERRVRERTEKLEAAVRELETFNYSASHDLRAPLRAINGYASLLERHLGDTVDAKSRRYLGLIETASERMGTLIEELRDYSRLGQDGVRAVPVPLEPLVAGLRAVYGERFAAAGGRIELADPAAVPLADPAAVPLADPAAVPLPDPAAVPLADPHLLERILANLVENALTYRRPDVPPVVTISAVHHGDRVTVSVADNGIGIPPEHRERIFDLFTRLHREDEYPGTGIGLSIVRKAAQLMGSDVAVASVEGEGSTFSLVLPAAAG